MDKFVEDQKKMIENHLQARGITDSKVLAAMQAVPREEFVLSDYRSQAYSDHPLPIEENQTISQPYIVALMAQALDIHPSDHILEIGTGSGYSAAVIAQIAKQVYGVEYFQKLVDVSHKRFLHLGYQNILVKQGDGNLGWKEHAPYQGISVTAAAIEIPQPLLEQLDINGRLVIPIGVPFESQKLICVTKKSHNDYSYTDLGEVTFVPLLGNIKNP